MGSAGTKNTSGLLWGNNLKTSQIQCSDCFRMGIFNYAGRDFETLWSSNAENYNQFSGDKKHKQ